MSLTFISIIFTFSTFVNSAHANEAPPEKVASLSSYGVNPTLVSISGVSSGGFMAAQMGVAYSSKFKAVASIAGGVYWCAEGDSERSRKVCMADPTQIDVTQSVAKVHELAKQGLVEDPQLMKRQKIFLFSTATDKVIHPLNSEKMEQFYLSFVPAKNIEKKLDFIAAHGFPTKAFGAACEKGFLPWLLKCDYDLAGVILEKAYGSLKSPKPMKLENLLKFNQQEFSDTSSSLFPEAWVYVPKICQKSRSGCKLHVALHGCQMNPSFIQDQFVVHAGYNEWAESNRLIVLYPQSNKSSPANPFGCWDWFGYTGDNYMTQEGVQMKGLAQMIERVVSTKSTRPPQSK